MTVCSKYTTNVVLEPASLTFGKEELSCVEMGTTIPTDGQSFTYSTLTSKYQVYFNVDAGGTVPTPADGETLIEVPINSTDTVDQISAKVKTAIEAITGAGYVFNPTSGEFLIEDEQIGETLKAIADVDTGWTFHVKTKGFSIDLGETDGAIEFAQENTLFEVKANQTGETLRAELLQGTTATITCALQSLSKDRLDLLIAECWGDKLELTNGPASADSSLIGAGTSKIGENSLNLAGKLIVHPIRLGADKSEDLTFWKTVPTLSGWAYDGLNKKVYNAEFKALVDEFRPKEINLFAIGDSTQQLA